MLVPDVHVTHLACGAQMLVPDVHVTHLACGVQMLVPDVHVTHLACGAQMLVSDVHVTHMACGAHTYAGVLRACHTHGLWSAHACVLHMLVSGVPVPLYTHRLSRGLETGPLSCLTLRW